MLFLNRKKRGKWAKKWTPFQFILKSTTFFVFLCLVFLFWALQISLWPTSPFLQVSQDGKALLDVLQRPLSPGNSDSLTATANYSKAVSAIPFPDWLFSFEKKKKIIIRLKTYTSNFRRYIASWMWFTRSSTISGVSRIFGSIERSDCTSGCSCVCSSKMSSRYTKTHAFTQKEQERSPEHREKKQNTEIVNSNCFPHENEESLFDLTETAAVSLFVSNTFFHLRRLLVAAEYRTLCEKFLR